MTRALARLLSRALPLALVVGGLAVSTRAGSATLHLVTDLVRSVLTVHELRTVAAAVREDFVRPDLPAPLYDEEAWAAYLDDLRDAPGREDALDLWEHPIGIERGEPTYRLRSLGPNGVRDAACEDPTLRASLTDPEAFLIRFETGSDAEVMDALADLDDDLCVEVGE